MKYLGLLVGTALLIASCGNKGGSNAESYKKAYELSHKAEDREGVIQNLTLWLANDSSISDWAYDTLAFYHYFYRVTPGAVRNSKTATYFVNEGLAKNSGSFFLKDIKAKLDLEEGKDTLAYESFDGMWKQTNDPTYYWDMAWIQIARGNLKVADSMVNWAITNKEILSKKVKMEHIQASYIENVPGEAAFMHLQALLANSRKDLMGAATYWQKSLEIFPEFYAARRSIMELQRLAAGQQ
jgi:hypothetical protein